MGCEAVGQWDSGAGSRDVRQWGCETVTWLWVMRPVDSESVKSSEAFKL